ncbi:polyketide synthase dehydratase domain-containing protein, partial [Streptomyces phaeochromogenes]|uniref:polyketide synthase dehydratase domain-containing protein n=1 Tax=Streptomyces phaeochromogenes TaxID=1923 RepID=UPI003696AA37
AALEELLVRVPQARRIPVDYASHSPYVDRIAEEIRDALDGITPRTGEIPFISSVTGEVLDTVGLDPEYWVTNLRRTVRFQDAILTALDRGDRVFTEISPHPVLTVGIEDTAGDMAVSVTGTLRRGDGGPRRLLTALADAFVRGVPVNWASLFSGEPPAPADLPTYAFQRRRFWLETGPAPGDLTATGLGSTDHPLLAAAVRLAGSDEIVLSGLLRPATQTWLADHLVQGSPVLPAAAVVDLAFSAGRQVGLDHLVELTLREPLVLPQQGEVVIQVRVGAPEPDGHRRVTLHSSTEDDDWTLHAEGALAQAPVADDVFDWRQWPPTGSEPLDLADFYENAAMTGYGYGPAFRGLRRAWRRGDEVFADIALPDERQAEAAGYCVHPALLDAALQSGLVRGTEEVRLPFVWSEVSLAAVGTSALRVRVRGAGDDAVSLVAADPEGRPVLTAAKVTSRPVPGGILRRAGTTSLLDALHALDWVPLQTAEGGVAPAPNLTVLDLASAREKGDPIDVVHTLLTEVLRRVQSLQADERLAVVTRSAVATGPGDTADDLVGAPVWGLLRSAQAENPGQLFLVDLDDSTDSPDVAVAAAVAAGEPQAAVRDGAVLAPRLKKAPRTTREEAGAIDEPLAEGQVRVRVLAAGLNFRDVLLSLDMYPGGGPMGAEAAGVVVEVGPGVSGLGVGDRVMGLVSGAFG